MIAAVDMSCLMHLEGLAHRRQIKFQFKHIAPGRYFVLAKPANDDSAKFAWDAARRATLRKEAEAAGNIVELAACQRVNDFKLAIK